MTPGIASLPTPYQTATACPECDLLVGEAPGSGNFTACCPRCGAHLYKQSGHGLQYSLALAIAALLLLATANAFPVVGLDINGQRIDTSVLGAANRLWQEGMQPVAVLVLLTTTILPLLELTAVIWMVLPLHFGRRPPGFAPLFRILQLAHPWAMIEVFILGVLVALVKLSHLADVLPGTAAWCFGGLMLLLTSLSAVIEPRDLWRAWEAARP
jgi:paraquat-inducible protein A